jgi:DNA-binding FadR family transcriptional regulator
MTCASNPFRMDEPSVAQSEPQKRARRRALVDEVRDLIAADFIFNGAVTAGQPLPSEAQLADRYGVSRVTLRAGMRSGSHDREADLGRAAG